MKSVMDLHTHTLVSGHAFNTMREMAQAAAEKGMEVLGITEHGPAMPGSCHNYYFHNLKIVPREMYGVKLLLGAEVNILDYDGSLDLNRREMKSLDVVIASMHKPCVPSGTVEENTRAYLAVLENPCVDIIGHPDDGRYATNHRELVKKARDCKKIIELNNNSLSPYSFRANAEENDEDILRLCMEYGVPIVVSSDAHMDIYINKFPFAEALLERIGFPEELILNRSYEALKPYLHR